MLGESVLSLIIVEDSPGRRYYVTFSTGVVGVTMMLWKMMPPLREPDITSTGASGEPPQPE